MIRGNLLLSKKYNLTTEDTEGTEGKFRIQESEFKIPESGFKIPLGLEWSLRLSNFRNAIMFHSSSVFSVSSVVSFFAFPLYPCHESPRVHQVFRVEGLL